MTPLWLHVCTTHKHSGPVGALFYITADNHTGANGEKSEQVVRTKGTAGITSMSGPVGFHVKH